MKNKEFIRIMDTVRPSELQKDKMLENILNKKSKHYWGYVWKFGMIPLCLFCTCIMLNHSKEPVDPILHKPRVLTNETQDFCYQERCYQKIGEMNKKGELIYIDTILEGNTKIEIYKGNTEETLILKQDDTYFLYQRLEG